MPWTLISSFFIFFSLYNLNAAENCLRQGRLLTKFLPKYAKGFKVMDYENYTVIEYKKDINKKELTRISISKKKSSQKCESEGKVLSKINRIGLTSSSHLAPMALLDITEKVKAVSRKDWFYHVELVSEAEELGYPANLEKVKKASIDILISNAVTELDMESLSRIEKEKVPVIIVNEFQEKTILGRAEWLVFFGALSGKIEEAKKLFETIASNYQQIVRKEKVEELKNVLVGFWNGNVWESTNQHSNISIALKDLGVKVLAPARKALELGPQLFSKEEAILLGKKSEYCLLQNNIRDLGQISSLFPEIKEFKCFKLKNILNNSKKINSGGANDYWETSGFRPDLLIKDLASLLSKNAPQIEMSWYEHIK